MMSADLMQAGIINGARRGMSPAFDAEHALADQPGPDNDTSGLSALNATLEAQKNAAVMAAAQSLKMEGQDGPGSGDAQASAGNAAASAPAISLPISLGATSYPATANVPNPLLTAGVPGQVAPTDGATAAQIPLSNTPSNNGFIAGGPVAAGGMEAAAPNSSSSAPADPYDVAMLAATGVLPADAASGNAAGSTMPQAMRPVSGMEAGLDDKDLSDSGAGSDGKRPQQAIRSVPGQTPTDIDIPEVHNRDGSMIARTAGVGFNIHPISQIADKDILGGRADPVAYSEATVDNDNKVINIAVKVKYEKTAFLNPTASQVSDEEYNKLVNLADAGIAKYWSRTITLDGQDWKVNVSAVNSSDGMPIKVANPGWKIFGELSSRSFNGFPYKEGTLYYDESTGRNSDAGFSLTAAHEIGHGFLTNAFGTKWSWGHENTSTRGGDIYPDVAPYPDTGEIGLMRYYSGHYLPSDYYDRSIASEDDVKTLLYISGRGK